MRCLVLVLIMAVTLLPGGGSIENPCKAWEFRCNNDRCISTNRFCDGTDDCGDSSDEVTGCTNCNQSLMGEVGTKYPLRITEPFQRNLPFVCKLHLVAGGGNALGERLELTFLSFQIGSLTLDRNGSEDRLECRRGFLRLSESQDDFFLGDDGSHNPVSTLRSKQTRGYKQLLSAFKEPPKKPLSELYDLTGNMEPDFGLFCGSLISSNLGVTFYSTGNNVTLSVYLPPRSSVGTTSMMGSFGLYLTYRFLSSSPTRISANEDKDTHEVYLGNMVGNTYCDRSFKNCDKKKCFIRSPNFPGLYLRNFTCSYMIRQDNVPPDKRAHIIVSQPNEYKISVNTGSSLMLSDPRKALNQGSSGLTTDCAGDVVRIYDRINSETSEDRLLLTEFCESGSLTDVVSSGPEMLVQLYSAPSNLLYESRLELEVRVEFVDADGSEGEFSFDRSSNCEIIVDGSKTRSGVIRSPRHSVPRNTSCIARLIGTSSQRVWLYFVSYFVQDHETLGYDHHPSSTEYQRSPLYEDACDISSLELFLNVQKNSSYYKFHHTKPPQLNYTYKFCEKSLPLMCTRASDYDDYIPKRPCLPPSESYISESSEVLLKYTFSMRASDVVSSLSATSFILKYEFVDTSFSGKGSSFEIPSTIPCGRNFSSEMDVSGIIQSPRNVFLYGRGGRDQLLCVYRFQMRPRERIVLEVLHFQSGINNCSTFFDPLLRRFYCRFNSETLSRQIPHRHAFLTFTETPSSSPVLFGCMCENAVQPISSIAFTSSSLEHSSTVTMNFDVSGMTAFEDFEDFSFSVRYQVIRANSSDRECNVLPDNLDRNRTHGGELTFQASPVRNILGDHPLRCQWFLQSSSTDTYLYLQLHGLSCDGRHELENLNRVVLYTSGSDGLMYPKTVLCLPSSTETTKSRSANDLFDFFSSSWHNNDSTTAQVLQRDDFRNFVAYHEKNQSITDKVIVELMAYRKGTLTIRWLEVTRPTSKPINGEIKEDEGRTMKNVNCLFECPELSACINPELWCDGVVHCPHSGYDESSENCQQTVTLYISVGFGCLVVCIGIGLVAFFLFRRYSEKRHNHQQTHPATFEHHPHCLQHNQHRDLSSKNFQNTSPVFIVGGSTKKKKKKNKDDFVRHIQTVEVRFPDIHM